MSGLLRELGVFGYDAVEPVILAALVTEDPLLLIGKAGTGKTYLLNSLSEALGLEHRHYNASLIAFDDLVGFPYPEENGEHIRYLETPATVWNAESVLVDEISRCKPEHQNRLFSLVHERRLQGIKIESLRYRWAAMNPCDLDQGADDHYEGSLPLDQALADRFAFVIEVPDWDRLSDEDRLLVANPAGDGRISEDSVGLRQAVQKARTLFAELIASAEEVLKYVATAGTMLGEAGLRVSPRRVRQLARNLMGLASLRDGGCTEAAFRLGLGWSLPHRAWGREPASNVINAIHRTAWDAAFGEGREAWLNQLLAEPRPHRKLRRILRESPDPDTGTLAVIQALAALPEPEALAAAFALYPAAVDDRLPISLEGVQALSDRATAAVSVNGEISWQERTSQQNSTHPDMARYAKALEGRAGARKKRAEQLFGALLLDKTPVESPENLEKEFNRCVTEVRTHLRIG